MANVTDALNALTNLVSAGSDVYFQSKSLDYADSKARLAQANVEIDRELQLERDDKSIAIKVIDAEMARLNRQEQALRKTLDGFEIEANKIGINLSSVGDVDKTNASKQVSKEIHDGTIQSYQAQLSSLSEEITQMQTQKSEYADQLASINLLSRDITGGGAGFTGGSSTTEFDKEDFTYEDYLTRSGETDQPYLKEAYNKLRPTDKQLMALNNALSSLEYKRSITSYKDAGVMASEKSAEQADYKRRYAAISNAIGPFQAMKSASIRYASNTEEEVLEKDTIELQLATVEFAKSADPISMAAMTKRLKENNLDWSNIVNPEKKLGVNQEKLTSKQKSVIQEASPLFNSNVNKIFSEAYNAISQLAGASGVAGSGGEFKNFLEKRTNQYNKLIKENTPESIASARILANKISELTRIDISNSIMLSELNLVVANTSDVPLEDDTLMLDEIITKDKDSQFLEGSADKILFKELFE